MKSVSFGLCPPCMHMWKDTLEKWKGELESSLSFSKSENQDVAHIQLLDGFSIDQAIPLSSNLFTASAVNL